MFQISGATSWTVMLKQNFSMVDTELLIAQFAEAILAKSSALIFHFINSFTWKPFMYKCVSN